MAERPTRTSCTATAFFQATSLLESGSNRCPAFARLTFSRSGCRNVQDVFPKPAALAKIDHHGRLLASLVEQESHAMNHQRFSRERHNRSTASMVADPSPASAFGIVDELLESCGVLGHEPGEPGGVDEAEGDEIAEMHAILVAE